MIRFLGHWLVVFIPLTLCGAMLVSTSKGQEVFPPPTPPMAPVADAPSPVHPQDSEQPAPPMAKPKPKSDGRVTLELTDGSRLIGKPNGLTKFRFQAQFGVVTIPWKQIAGIRFTNPDGQVPESRDNSTIVFNNGDVLRGQVLLENIELNSAWGKAQVAVELLHSIINSAEQHTWWRWNGQWRLNRGNQYPDTGLPGNYPQPYGAPEAVPDSIPPHLVPGSSLYPVLPRRAAGTDAKAPSRIYGPY